MPPEEVKVALEDGGGSAKPAIELVDEPQHSGPTPEEALAKSREAVQRSEQAARDAQQREQHAQAELQRVRASQQQDQAAVLASVVEASTAERDRHASAWQQAMEAGDFALAARHNSDLAMATARLDRATADLAVSKASAQRQQQQPGGQQQQPAVSNRSQDWINSHPEFNRHRDALIKKHHELVNDGVQSDSPRYFRELDSEYDRLTGKGGDRAGGDTMSNSDRGFGGATPSRGGGAGSNANTVQTLLGPVGVRTSNGQTLLQIPPHLRELFNAGAKDCGMSVSDYAYEQVQIARERQAGGTGSLIESEGRTYK